MIVMLVPRVLSLAWLALFAGLVAGCSFKSSKPAADITLAQPSAATPDAAARAQVTPAPGGGVSMPAPSSDAPTLLTATGASTNVRASDTGSVATPSSADRGAQVTNSPIAYKQVVSEYRPKHCKGQDCPSLNIRRVEFAGQSKFNTFLDHALATMAGVDQEFVPPYRNLKELINYFQQTAKPRQTIDLQSDVVRATDEVIVVRLNSYLFNGGANGMSATQYVNWVFKTDRLLSLESMLVPGAMPKYLAVLKAQHVKWLATNPVRQDNPAKYDQVWPFVPSDNVALMENGLAVQYDPYSIAPGSFGMPVITIPYDALQGIIRPEVMQLGKAPTLHRRSR